MVGAQVRMMRINDNPHPLPSYSKPGDAGVDIRAHLKAPLTIKPGEHELVPTGWKMAVPFGWEAQVRTRSGMAHKDGLVVKNSPGTIDSGYRGEVMVMLWNTGAIERIVSPGDRIAQLVIAQVPQTHFVEANALEETVRGEGGFGSTGVA